MAVQTVAGPMRIVYNGKVLTVMGDHTYNLGFMKNEAIQGPNNEMHGIKKTPQPGKVSGKIVVTPEILPLIPEIMALEGATVILTLPQGGAVTYTDAFQTSEGDGSTEEGTIDYEFTGTATMIDTTASIAQNLPSIG